MSTVAVVSFLVLAHNPFAYLRDVTDKLAHGWLQSRLDELLPGQWSPDAVTLDCTPAR